MKYMIKKSEWHLITDADHGFGGQEEQAAHIASDFLAKVLLRVFYFFSKIIMVICG